MSDLPKISIVTPSFNQQPFIEQTIQSVLNQDYPNLEHIIVDGGSTDGTIDILRRYPHLRWLSTHDRGQSHALNKGFKMASGKIIGWLNSDDLYLPNAVRMAVDAFSKYPDVTAVYGDYVAIDPNGKVVAYKREIPFHFDTMLYWGCYIGQPALFFREEVFKSVGYIDEELHYTMDWEFWLRMARSGLRFRHIKRLLASARWYPTAKSWQGSDRQRFEVEAVRNRYWSKKRFENRDLHRLYGGYLQYKYRVYRQLAKLWYQGTVDFPPSHWRVYLRGR